MMQNMDDLVQHKQNIMPIEKFIENIDSALISINNLSQPLR